MWTDTSQQCAHEGPVQTAFRGKGYQQLPVETVCRGDTWKWELEEGCEIARGRGFE